MGLGDMIDKGMPPAVGPEGSVEEVDIYEEFQAAALKAIDPSKVGPLKVVVDGGNGMAGPMVGPILEQLNVELIETYWKPDGDFPDRVSAALRPDRPEVEVVGYTGGQSASVMEIGVE